MGPALPVRGLLMGWDMGPQGMQWPEHRLLGETHRKPQNSLLQRTLYYKSGDARQ